MLRVSIHAGPLAKISRSNRLDWLDIGYQRLAPAADYKIVLFKIGEGAVQASQFADQCPSLFFRDLRIDHPIDLANREHNLLDAFDKTGDRYRIRGLLCLCRAFANEQRQNQQADGRQATRHD